MSKSITHPSHILPPQEMIESKIYTIRGKRIMLDEQLAILYGVETKYLTRQVRRNRKRFPEDFIRLRRRPRL